MFPKWERWPPKGVKNTGIKKWIVNYKYIPLQLIYSSEDKIYCLWDHYSWASLSVLPGGGGGGQLLIPLANFL